MNVIKIGNAGQNIPLESGNVVRYGSGIGSGRSVEASTDSQDKFRAVGANGDVMESSAAPERQAGQAGDARTAEKSRTGSPAVKDGLGKAVGELNETARVFNIRLRFEVDRETGDTCVLVIDLDKGEIIRKIPPAKALDLAYSVYDTVGLLFDTIV